MGSYLVGTDEHVLASTTSGPGSVWRRVSLPAGLQHAVLAGERLALCGVSPAIVWHSFVFKERSDSCPVCWLLSASGV